MNQPVVHPTLAPTLRQLHETGLPQALLLSGEKGVGLGTIAKWLAGDDLHERVEPTATSKTVTRVISIDDIRHLYQSLTTKSARPRVVIIDDADAMTMPAQNAFLKLLEEPPAALHFILTSHSESTLLPTIHSRLQHFRVPTLSVPDSQKFLDQLVPTLDETRQRQLLFIASGQPAELRRLIDDGAHFAVQSQRFREAREFLSATVYQKVSQLAKLTSRDMALELLDTVLVILRRSVSGRPDTTTVREMQKLLAAKEAISRGGNLKLQLLRAVV